MPAVQKPEKLYRGPGKLVSTVGRAILESLVVGVASSLIAGLFVLSGGTMPAILGLGLGLLQLGALVHGGIKGYQSAVRGEEQVHTLAMQVGMTAPAPTHARASEIENPEVARQNFLQSEMQRRNVASQQPQPGVGV